MVTSFTTAENKYSFEIDGKPYELQTLTYGEFEDIDPTRDRADVYQELLSAKADERTLAAIRTLALPQLGRLLKEWVGGNTETTAP